MSARSLITPPCRHYRCAAAPDNRGLRIPPAFPADSLCGLPLICGRPDLLASVRHGRVDRNGVSARRLRRPCGARAGWLGRSGADARRGQGARRAPVRGERGPAGLLQPRRARPVVGLRRRLLPRSGGGDLRRSQPSRARATHRRSALSGAEGRQDRRPVAQFDLDHGARGLLRSRVRGHHLLRRPGLHGAARDARLLGARARRREGLRAQRDDDDRQPRRLLLRQPPGAADRRGAIDRRAHQGL